MAYESIPQELKDIPQWVCWQSVDRGGKMTKVPINPHTGRAASSTNPSTWSTFDCAAKVGNSYSGIGFVFTQGDPYVGIDMDGHVDQDLVEYFQSYTEYSQSGKGAHIICKGKLPFDGKRNAKYEVYSNSRFFIFTGNVIEPYTDIDECQQQIDTFISHVFHLGGSDDEKRNEPEIQYKYLQEESVDVLDMIRASGQADKFDDLWNGGMGDSPSTSEADAALLSILRFWTGGDKAKSFALFAQSNRVRKKWEREDYRDRTWASVDNGDVYQEPYSDIVNNSARIEHIPASFVEANISPWRKVTAQDVEKIVKGTILGEIIEILRQPTDPKLPFEIGFAKALPIMGAAMSGKRDEKNLYDLSFGVGKAKVRIDTGGGQAMNIWTILIAESASGKDIGGVSTIAMRESGLLIGQAGSEEGIADALCDNGNGVIQIGEMQNWLDKRHWQHKAASFMTNVYSNGSFNFVMSKRNKDAPPERKTDFCFPSIMANIQPGIINHLATRQDLENGFLGRFAIIKMDDPTWFPFPRSGYDAQGDARRLMQIINYLSELEGVVETIQGLHKPFVMEFVNARAEPVPTYRRLCNEYLMRIAVMLGTTFDDGLPQGIDQDLLDRAAVIVRWLFSMAESVLVEIKGDAETNQFESNVKRFVNMVKAEGGVGLSSRKYAHNFGHGTKAKDREQIAKEAVDRSWVRVERDGKAVKFFMP